MKNTMKKLMIATLGLVVAGSVFADPQVFDYKASVKHMYLKEVNIRTQAFNGRVYQKFAKSASLKGFLIMDADGVTSPVVSAGEGMTASTATAADYGRNRGFLVVQNSKAEAQVRAPKILPAVLDAKWIDTQFRRNHEATSGLAEGTLFVGGDFVAPVRPQIDMLAGVETDRGVTAAGAAIADYVWTSIYLFGNYNGPYWFSRGVKPFDTFEQAWDANLPAGVQIGAPGRALANRFHDTWMNGAGIGKWRMPRAGEVCCGAEDVTSRMLESLTGNLKGGLFLCTENGTAVLAGGNNNYSWFDGTEWEDQFNCSRLTPAGSYNPDIWQDDLWQDGPMEQATSDVLFGSWSIRWNTRNITVPLTAVEQAALVRPDTELVGLWTTIKGAARMLNRNAILFNGTEIHTRTRNGDYNTIPMVTPQFVAHYGLN